MRKKVVSGVPASETWSQSELRGFAGAWLFIGLMLGAVACGLVKPSYREGYDAVKRENQEWEQQMLDDYRTKYRQGVDDTQEEAARYGTGRYEIDPTTGEIEFKWLKPCDCKECCKCTK